MTVVDVHTHAVPQFVIDEAADNRFFGVRVVGDEIVHPDGETYPFQPEYHDPAARAARLEKTAIDVDIISIDPSFLFYSQPRDEAIEVTKRVNDAGAGRRGC